MSICFMFLCLASLIRIRLPWSCWRSRFLDNHNGQSTSTIPTTHLCKCDGDFEVAKQADIYIITADTSSSGSEPVVIVGNSSISSYHPSIVYCKLTQSMSHNAHSVPAWFWRTTMAMLQPVYDLKLCHSKIKLQSYGSPSKSSPCLRLVDMSELASYSLFRAGARHRPTINSNILSIYSTYLTI